MKRVVSFLITSVFALILFPTSVFAETIDVDPNQSYSEAKIIDFYAERLDEDVLVVHSVTLTKRGFNSKTATHTENFYTSGTLIATISMQATFYYDGSTVSVASKSVTQTSTYNGWNYTQNSFSSSGGTVTLTGTISKLFHINQTFSMSLTCDKDGNISAA